MIKTELLQFETVISSNELHLFRGAIIKSSKDKHHFFHNHVEDEKFNYSYPLIQYKRILGNASILAIGEGIEVLKSCFDFKTEQTLTLGSRKAILKLAYINTQTLNIEIKDERIVYSISNWLPFNQSNINNYNKMESLAEKSVFLEKILIGNILSFAKGVGIYLDEQIICKIRDFDDSQLVDFKGVKMKSVKAEFSVNLMLPNFIGLGKGSSINKGVIIKK